MITKNQCSCPPAAALKDIPNVTCSENMGQIQRLIFQRKQKTPVFDDTTKTPTKLATWTPLLTAEDNTKVVVTPYVENPELTSGEARTAGGGNASLNGADIVLGHSASTFTGLFNEVPQEVIDAIASLRCEDLAVAFVTEDGKIWMQYDKEGKKYDLCPIIFRTLGVGDITGGKFDDRSGNAIQFALPAGYSRLLKPVSPEDFNALTDLAQ